MNYKEEVISRMRALIDMGRSPSVEMLERWVIMLEQQTPPVAIGEPRAGESSVQPVALNKFREWLEAEFNAAWKEVAEAHMKCPKGEEAREATHVHYTLWRCRKEFDRIFEAALQVKHEAEHRAAG